MQLVHGFIDAAVQPALSSGEHQSGGIVLAVGELGICLHEPFQILSRLQRSQIQEIVPADGELLLDGGNCRRIRHRMEALLIDTAVHHPNLVGELGKIADDLLLGELGVRHNAVCPLHGLFQAGFQHIFGSAPHRLGKCLVHHVVHGDDLLSRHIRRNDVVEKVGDLRPVPEKMPVGHGQEVGHQPIDIARCLCPVGLHVVPQIRGKPFDLDVFILAGEELQQEFVLRMQLCQRLNLSCLTVPDAGHPAADQRQHIKCNTQISFRSSPIEIRF